MDREIVAALAIYMTLASALAWTFVVLPLFGEDWGWMYLIYFITIAPIAIGFTAWSYLLWKDVREA